MLMVSFLSGLPVLLLMHKLSLPRAVFCALTGSICGTMTELYSSSELDTIAVPIMIAAVLLLTARVGQRSYSARKTE